MSKDPSSDNSETTHFGFQQVPLPEKAAKVANVFRSVVDSYDVMNDVMSLGIHRLWKRFAIDLSAIRPGHRVLDIAGGTGDLSLKYAAKVGDEGEVILTDINGAMLNKGRDRLIDTGVTGNIKYVQANAECLPFVDNYFDCISIAFGLRNVSRIEVALSSMYRALKPGGRVIILEFSKPTTTPLKRVYDTYSFKVLPLLGKLIANDSESYRYLAESIRMHPNQSRLLEMMKNAGFESCEYFNLSGGIVALHRGYKY